MDNKEFEYTYTAPTEAERREITSIRRQYEAKSDKQIKLDRIRKLDNFVRNFSMTLSLIVGVMGALIFGLGMSMILVWDIMIFGIVVCIIGAAPMVAAYPVYLITLKNNKEKYGEEILRLSEELLNKSDNG
ncbi:MAG: hypothetical protein IJW19_01620 [Clostridia bacterium]|nr:hypothetical protein [Clostridia bacterium]